MVRGGVFKKPTLLGSPLTWVMGALFLASVVGLAIFYDNSDRKPDFIFELAKALLQIGVISVAGTLLSVLVSGHERRLANQRTQEELLKATLASITASYNQAKAARRKMRAVGLFGEPRDGQLRIPRYDEIMAEVIDAQLDLETIISDIETNTSTYPSARRILPRLKLMEDYLGQLIKEYEKERPKVVPEIGELHLGKLDAMSDFVARAKQKPKPRFLRRFARAHSSVRRSIRSDLLGLVGSKRMNSG